MDYFHFHFVIIPLSVLDLQTPTKAGNLWSLAGLVYKMV